VIQLSAWRETVDQAMSCLDYIILMVVLFAGALAFIVTFNLTNINLAERSREIATVEVLGFYPKETESYVLRENIVLSILAAVLGLPLGTISHRIVMSKILLDIMTYQVHVRPVSYLMAFACTIVFALFVNIVMRRQITKIPMAESLKAVE
jgi:putative ABC transport system permease protein